jgi:hypothetical protein
MGSLTWQCHDDDDPVANLIQRRYLGTLAAMETAEKDGRVLREVIKLAEESWVSSRQRLAELETLLDSLSEQLLQRDLAQTYPRVSGTPIFFTATSAVCDVGHETLRCSSYG